MNRLVGLVLASLALSPAHALTVFREAEPNNNRPQAQFLNTTDSDILVLGDRTNNNRSSDWYRVWGERDSIFNLLVTTPTGSTFGNDPVLGLFDSTGRELAFSDDLMGGYGLDAGIFNYRIDATGYYYIAVSAKGDRNFRGGGSGGNQSIWVYNLTINRTAVPEPSEWALIGLTVLGVTGLMRRAALRAKNPPIYQSE
jgi:hypothetical protein